MSDFDLLSTEIRSCPHARYQALNSKPVLPAPGHPNFWIVSGYETVSEVLMDPVTYSGQPFPGQEVNIMSAMSPEPHKRLRGAIQALFTNQSLAMLTPHIEAQAVRRTKALLAVSGGDLMQLWANPIPLSVIARLFGFPEQESDLARLHRYGDAAVRLVIPFGGPGLPAPRGIRHRWRLLRGLLAALPPVLRLLWRLPAAERKALANLPNPMADLPGYPRTGFRHHPELIRAIVEFQLEVLDIFRSHLKQPREEVIDALIPPYRRGELRLGEVLSSALQILVAGYETTANTLATAVYRMARSPGLMEELRSEPERIEPFIEELLRLDAPLQRTLRRTTQEVVLAGVHLPENAQLILMLGAANLDVSKFDYPEAFDAMRGNARRHLSFGRGIHMCIGAQLARLEARIALRVFVESVARVKLLSADPPTRITDKDIGMWGFARLPVHVESRG